MLREKLGAKTAYPGCADKVLAVSNAKSLGAAPRAPGGLRSARGKGG